jgi:L-threonylcarbamoyladenylate synthase
LEGINGKSMAIIGTSIQEAGAWLRDGWPVGIPTETVYGLAANACDREALLRVFETKGRPLTDPLIVHLASQEELNRYAVDVPDTAYALLEAFSPGPLTLILPKAPILPDEVSAGLKTAGFRIPRHPLTLELLRSLDFPLAAPSANLFGRTSPTTADHVADQLGEQIPYILDGGPCRIGVESTVLDLSGPEPLLLREGGLTAESLEAFLGRPLQRPNRLDKRIRPNERPEHWPIITRPRYPCFCLRTTWLSWIGLTITNTSTKGPNHQRSCALIKR